MRPQQQGGFNRLPPGPLVEMLPRLTGSGALQGSFQGAVLAAAISVQSRRCLRTSPSPSAYGRNKKWLGNALRQQDLSLVAAVPVQAEPTLGTRPCASGAPNPRHLPLAQVGTWLSAVLQHEGAPRLPALGYFCTLRAPGSKATVSAEG